VVLKAVIDASIAVKAFSQYKQLVGSITLPMLGLKVAKVKAQISS